MNRPTAAALALLLAVTFAAYLPSIDGPFVFDDEAVATAGWLKDLGAFASPATWRTLTRPVTSFTFALNYAAVGHDTRGWHLTNVAVHLVAVVLGWAFALRILRRARLSAPEWPAFAAAALFALHPLQTQAVSYLSQRAEGLAAAAWTAGLLLLLTWDEASGESRRWLLLGAIGVHVLGLGAKPTAATLPAAWLLIAAMLPPTGERDDPWTRRLGRRLPAAVPLLALSAIAAVMGVASAQETSHAGFGIPNLPLDAHLATQARAVAAYLLAIAWPAGQTIDPLFPPSRSLLEPGVLASGAALGVLGWLALSVPSRIADQEGDLAAAKRVSCLAFALFVTALAPTILVPLHDPYAEHRAYLGLLAIATAAAAAGATAFRRMQLRSAWAGAFAAALAAILLLVTSSRNKVWRDELALWSDAAAKTPGKGRPHAYLGLALQRANRLQEAAQEYDRALAILDPDVENGVVLENLSAILLALRQPDAARERLSAYVARVPDPVAIAMLGRVELDSGRVELAERLALQAMDARVTGPGDDVDRTLRQARARGTQLLGEVRELRGELAGAAAAFSESEQLDPGSPAAPYGLGRVMERLGRTPEACAAYGRAAASPFPGLSRERGEIAFTRLRCSLGAVR